jgi:PAS domain S-box-containing protein
VAGHGRRMTRTEDRDRTDLRAGVFSRYEAVFQAAPDAILVVDHAGAIQDANPQALALLGFEREELLGEPVERVVPREARARHRAHREEYAEDPRPRPMGVGLELRALRKDGRTVPVEISLSPFETPDGRFIIAAVRDVSERRRLRHLGTGTLRAAEEERRRIARELHDETAQSLAALLIRLGILKRTEDPAVRARLVDEMHDELELAVEGVRRISRGLRPPALEDVGVSAALRGHVRGVLERASFEASVRVDPVDELLDPEVQLALYRVVQEALANVVRHADASSITVEVIRVDGEVSARIADDGRGFDPDDEILAERGLGLVGMEERARLAGGALTLSSFPGTGTEVVLRLPTREGQDG